MLQVGEHDACSTEETIFNHIGVYYPSPNGFERERVEPVPNKSSLSLVLIEH